jgi:hypothetical protein
MNVTYAPKLWVAATNNGMVFSKSVTEHAPFKGLPIPEPAFLHDSQNSATGEMQRD